MKSLRIVIISLGFMLICSAAGAVGGSGGGWSFGANVGIVNADQDDMNSEITARSETTGAKDFGNAWEGNVFLSYQIQGSNVTMMFRPSYFFYEDEDGTASSYSLSGFTLFPMLRWILLSDQTIRFYSQLGVGYGRMSGTIEDAGMKIDFAGGAIGYMAGLGAEFCFVDSHCFNVEGNIRVLDIDRMTVDKATGTAPAGTTITQASKGKEFEVNGRDFGTSMSGVVGLVGYAFHF